MISSFSRYAAVWAVVSFAPAVCAITITNESPLPPGSVGTAYSLALTAGGGSPPYIWAVLAGAPPAGLTLSASGVLAGIPTSVSTAEFQVRVTDSTGASAGKTFTMSIAPGPGNLVIVTASLLPGGLVGAAYSQMLTAAGGTPPYSWSLISGALPNGLTLNSTAGVIAGTPTNSGSSAFDVNVTDSRTATARQHFTIAITASSPVPTLSVTGVPAAVPSASQVPFGVTLSFPYTTTVNGQIALSFEPEAAIARDDPAIQLSSGGRTIDFTIPAGTTHAVFSASPMAFQTGTVAGTIALAATSDLPGGSARSSTAVSRAAPVIRTATIVPKASGFEVQVAGFSNSRELAAASFHFTAKSGQILQTGDLTVNLATLAGQWYGGASSTSYGGQFLLMVPFTVEQGAAAGLASVSVEVQNAQAVSAPAAANF